MTGPEQSARPGDPVAADTQIDTAPLERFDVETISDFVAVAGCTVPDYDDASAPHGGALDEAGE